ncbi:phenylalanine--tRNA ligase subunit beta [Candidatus Pacearchaeota archaeon CG10_big_fil_rev_8_21_14_0_10_35_13]|nr:MAG: phenylalanine--tRNA ligase subunit beta [Candidatus Pacearchaeota archaeon CG10_big_fil_rev_8_21_14_0_10_35_13]
MANVKFSRKEFEKSIKINDEIIERINMMGTPVESINEENIEIEVFPNRPDLLSMGGFIRALQTFTGKNSGIKKYKINDSGKKLIVEKTIPKEWSRAYACMIKGIKFDEQKILEIIQLQEKLGSTLLRERKKGGIGLYPQEMIEFPVRFVGMKPEEIIFRPLEYQEMINAKQIMIKHPTGRKYADITKGWEKLPVFVDAKNRIMSMPPIINSHELGKITEETKNVFLEVTGPASAEKVLKNALVIMATALAEMGGTIHTIECKQIEGKALKEPVMTPEIMKINKESAEKLLGVKISDKEMKKYLGMMGYDYDDKKKTVQIPSWRIDVMHEVDLIEDLAIARGYENIEPVIPQIANIAEESKGWISERKISEMLAGLGMIETKTYHLVRKEDYKKMGQKPEILVEKSKTEYEALRNNLTNNLFRVLSENVDAEYPQRIYELGTIFKKDNLGKTDTGIIEKKHLAIAITPGSYTQMKQALQYLTEMLGMNYEVKETKKKGLIDGRTAEIIIKGKTVGIIGEAHPMTLKNWKLKMPAVVMEIDIEGMIN